MAEMMNDIVKRQLRYKDSVYDILCSVKLGECTYSIIGKGTDSKFYDIDFVEQRNENGKQKYISPIVNFEFNDSLDFSRLQGHLFMNYIRNNKIMDKLSEDAEINRDETIKIINEIIKIIENSSDIKSFFENNNRYTSENQFENSIKVLIDYYNEQEKKYYEENSINNIHKSSEKIDIEDGSVNEVYSELDNTQNFGISLLYDYNMMKKKEEAEHAKVLSETQPEQNNNTNNSFQKIAIDAKKEEQFEKNETSMSFQEKMFLENEKLMESKKVNVANDELNNKAKTLTLKQNKPSNAAYITISLLLCLIGSFELLLSIILLVRFV